MNQRNADAVAIQQGACNPSGIARALVKAIDEARAENVDVRSDPACRLITHQLAYIMGVQEIDSGALDVYGKLMKAVEATNA